MAKVYNDQNTNIRKYGFGISIFYAVLAVLFLLDIVGIFRILIFSVSMGFAWYMFISSIVCLIGVLIALIYANKNKGAGVIKQIKMNKVILIVLGFSVIGTFVAIPAGVIWYMQYQRYMFLKNN
ncbi:hypothetical protein [[Acholeplasma] multilocale]|uniref:hypothetical protein n=1 Tax=[Acholeplasma] multilocale TaxID=264638 RepID=UPI00047A28F8|nr:hypothetical protein [[Acholeplasma] multilocale]